MHKVIERILNLLAFLLTAARPATAEEIRHVVAGYDQDNDEAFRRMFERDKDLLRQLGFPLEMRPTDAWQVEHGYVVDEEYAMADPGLSDEERAALWLAAQVVRIGGSAAGPSALFKLGGAPMAGGGEPLAADLGSDVDQLAVAFTAVAERRAVQFDYRDRAREVHPYGLVHRRGHWYLVGPAPDDDTVKAYRLDRATGLTAHGNGDAFRRPRDFRAEAAIPAASWEAGSEDTEAKVVFDPEVAWWAERQLVGSTGTKRDDGSLEASVRVANPDAFIGWLLGFGAAAELLEPPSLRERLLERVRGER